MLFHPTRFWNLLAGHYARKPVANPGAYQHKLDTTARYLEPNQTVFEFGCGTGTTALIHAPRVASIDAIDFSAKMIAIAQQKADAAGVSNVQFAVSSLDDWPLPSAGGQYDVALGMSILHLLPDLDAALSRVAAFLRPGGRFFSSTVCLGDAGGIAKHVIRPFSAIGILPRVLPLTETCLVDRLRHHGFVIEETWKPGSSPSVFIVAQKPAGSA